MDVPPRATGVGTRVAVGGRATTMGALLDEPDLLDGTFVAVGDDAGSSVGGAGVGLSSAGVGGTGCVGMMTVAWAVGVGVAGTGVGVGVAVSTRTGGSGSIASPGGSVPC